MKQALDLRGDDGSDCSRSSEDCYTPVDILLLAEKEVHVEIKLVKAVPKNAWSLLKYLSRWATLSATRDLPCLRVVTIVMRCLKLGSGELEICIGLTVDLFTPKRAILGPGYIEALSFMRINKYRVQYDARLVCDLPTWKKYISGRHSKIPKLLRRGFAAEEDGFNDPVDRNVVERYGNSS